MLSVQYDFCKTINHTKYNHFKRESWTLWCRSQAPFSDAQGRNQRGARGAEPPCKKLGPPVKVGCLSLQSKSITIISLYCTCKLTYVRTYKLTFPMYSYFSVHYISTVLQGSPLSGPRANLGPLRHFGWPFEEFKTSIEIGPPSCF